MYRSQKMLSILNISALILVKTKSRYNSKSNGSLVGWTLFLPSLIDVGRECGHYGQSFVAAA